MRTIGAFMCLLLLAVAALWAQGAGTRGVSQNPPAPEAISIEKGAKWLAAVQGADGGWGQDGGETSYVRTGEHLESNGNDVANTAVATLALLPAGRKDQAHVETVMVVI